MILKNYKLIFKDKLLLENVNIEFYTGQINHILGKNGVGKSKMAQDLYINQNENILSIGLISSFTNIPMDVTLNDLMCLVKENYPKNKIDTLSQLLNLTNINPRLKVGMLSDGQRQKIKLFIFLMVDYDVLILDEITNALDKKTTDDIYQFLLEYIKLYPQKCIINITHNLSDLSHMGGNYFLIENHGIKEYRSQESIITRYIEGE